MITSGLGPVLALVPSHPNDLDAGVSSSTDPTQIVVANILSNPDSLDPCVDYENVGWEIIQNVYETLVFYDGSSASELVPMLCDEVPTESNGLITDAGCTYTYNLRSGVKFHDGTTLDSEDVYYSFERALRLYDPHGPVWMVGEVLIPDFYTYTAGSFDAGGVLIDGVPSDVIRQHIWVQDQDTITFNLTFAFAGWNSIMAAGVASIISMEYVEANGGQNQLGYDFMAYHMCGTGAFSFTEYVPSGHILLTRFDDYWQGPAQVASVLIQQVSDDGTRLYMILHGEADFATIPRSLRSSVVGSEGVEIGEGNGTFTLNSIGLNQAIDTSVLDPTYTDVPADFFADVNVRKAFAHAFDYDAFISVIYDGTGIRPNGIIPYGMFGYSAGVPTYDYNLTKVRDRLENGTTDYYSTGFKLELFYNNGNVMRQTICELFKQGLEAACDKIEITVTGLDWSTYLSRRVNDQLPLFFLGWSPDYADPNNYVQPFLFSAGTFTQDIGYSNATLDQMISDAMVEQDLAIRAGMYEDISNDTYEECLYIWTIQTIQFNVHRSWADGYVFNPMYAGLYFYPMSLDIHLPPGAPDTFEAEPGDASASLTWTAPSYSGTDPVDNYGIYQNGTLITTTTGTSITISGLVNGVTYTFSVAAHNAVDYGTLSDAIDVTPYRLPGAPTGLAGVIDVDHIDLTWNAPSDKGDPALNYYIVYRDGVDVQHVTSASATVTGLTVGSSVTFSVRAHNIGGLGPASSNLVVNVPATIPTAAQNLRVTSNNVTVGLAWDAPASDGGSAIQYYIVYQDGVDIAHPTTKSCTVSGLQVGVEYEFKVSAKNTVGTGPFSNVVHVVQASVPGVPISVTLSVTQVNVTVSWEPPTSNGSLAIDHYLVTVNGGNHIVTSTHLDLVYLTPGETYSVTVKAHNALGYGNATTAASVTIARSPSTVIGLNATAGDGFVLLTWSAPASDGGQAITSYRVRLNGTAYANVTGTTLNITGLVNGVTYNFTVSAVNVIGEGTGIMVEAMPLGLPDAPFISGLSRLEETLTVTWDPPEDDGGAEIEYYAVYLDGVEIGRTTNTVYIMTILDQEVHLIEVNVHTAAGDSPLANVTVPGIEDEGGSDMTIILAIGAVLAVVVIVAAVLLLRRRG